MWFWDRRGGESSVRLNSCGNFFQETNLTSSVLIRNFLSGNLTRAQNFPDETSY